MQYKGYTTEVQVDTADGRLYGKVLGITDAVNYEASSVAEVEEAFYTAVDACVPQRGGSRRGRTWAILTFACHRESIERWRTGLCVTMCS